MQENLAMLPPQSSHSPSRQQSSYVYSPYVNEDYMVYSSQPYQPMLTDTIYQQSQNIPLNYDDQINYSITQHQTQAEQRAQQTWQFYQQHNSEQDINMLEVDQIRSPVYIQTQVSRNMTSFSYLKI